MIYFAANAQGWNHIKLRVTFITYAREGLRFWYLLPGDIYPRHTGIGAGNPQGPGGCISVCHVRIVTILTLHVRGNPIP